MAVRPRLVSGTHGHSRLPYVTDPVSGLGLTQSDHDPCYYFKVYPDGSRLDAGLYVDDTWLIDNGGKAADADLEKLGKRFDLKLESRPSSFST